MTTTNYSQLQDFLESQLPFLEQEEALNNKLIGTLLSRSKCGKTVDLNFWSVEEKEHTQLVAVLFGTNVLIYSPNTYLKDSIPVFCDHLAHLRQRVDNLLAPTTCVQEFLKYWQGPSEVHMETIVYQLTQVDNTSIVWPEGAFRLAQKQDEAIISDYLYHFVKEAIGGETRYWAKAKAKELIEEQSIFVWENKEGEPSSISATVRYTRNGAAISYVYTPEEFRRKGFATAAVAGLSQHLLNQGRSFCSLFADQSNSYSNKIYQNIGYEKITNFQLVKL